MKASQLIIALQEAIAKHGGDFTVVSEDGSDPSDLTEIISVRFEPKGQYFNASAFFFDTPIFIL